MLNDQCRTCLNQTNCLRSLSELAIEESSQQMTYGELLREVANINVQEEPNLEMPRNICISCSRKLKSSHEFIKQAQEANHKCLASLLVTKKSNNSIKVDCLQESEIDIRQCLEIKIEVGEEIKQVCEDGVRVDFVSDEHKCKLEPKFEVLEDNVSCENMPEISKNSAIEVTDTVDSLFDNEISSDLSNKGLTDFSESGSENEEIAVTHPRKQKIESSHGRQRLLRERKRGLFKDHEGDDADIAVPCLQCNKIFNNSKELTRHLRNTHVSEEQKCTCPICGAKFTRSCNMYKHMRTLHDPEAVKKLLPAKEKTHQCVKCPRKYTKKKHLNYHIRAKHSRSEGDRCQQNVQAEEGTNATDSKKKPEVRPLCFVCGGSFSNKAHLIVHMRRHTGERPFKCDLCERAFPRISELTCHRRIHTGEKPYKCKICEKSFRVSTKLATHMRSHTDERPYKCKQCERSFKYSKDLNIHNRIHTGERPYCCTVCGSTFTQSNSLKAHRMKLGHI